MEARLDFDAEAFTRLQQGLARVWSDLTMRGVSSERTLIVVSSVSFAIPEHYHLLLPAYEERYLTYVLTLLRAPNTRVVYVTSQPILPRMLDYYLGLVPGVDRDDVMRRLVPLSVGDWSPKPLTQKILDRPRFVERLRLLIPDPTKALILPFATTALEARLSVELGVPVYGPDPRLLPLGTKTGSREVFAAAGVPHPRGRERVRTPADVAGFLAELGASGVDEAIVKLDGSVSGIGNAVVDLRGATDRLKIERRVRHLRPEDPGFEPASFLDALEAEGGIVEERIAGDGFASPSVQLRNSPEGEVEVLTTHDQVLGGLTGQTYFGCRFPAAPAYARIITAHALAAGRELARRGVIGRYGIDFVVTRGKRDWSAYAVEINLRNGGTTHPYLALLALTEGTYDPEWAQFVADGKLKHYVASDHLEVPGLSTLTPDDVLDIVDDCGLGWDAGSMTGAVFHMLSGVGVAGRVGVTTIADSGEGAVAWFERVQGALAAVTAQPGVHGPPACEFRTLAPVAPPETAPT